MTAFEIEEAWVFEPSMKAAPMSGHSNSYATSLSKRRQIKDKADRTGRYDIREKTIKLALNSIYGKLAQSVGGDGKAPTVANPYYAAATTAYCRRRLIEAALLDPHAIVFFATDGIVSTRPLIGLARVQERREMLSNSATGNAARPTEVSSSCRASTPTGKSRTDESGARTIKPVTKIRGGDAKKYAAKVKASQWLIENVLAAWRKPFDPQKPEHVPAHRRPLSEVHHGRKRVGVASSLEAGRALDGATGRAGRGNARDQRA